MMRSARTRPLEGLVVYVTRAAAQAGGTASLLRRQGARVRTVPLIETVPLEDPAPLDRALASARAYDWIVFTSANGVDHVMTRLGRRGASRLCGPRLAAIGPGTAAALSRAGLRADLVAGEHLAEGLARTLAERGVRGRRILILRARIARPVLERKLSAAGARVRVVPAYQTRPSEAGARRLANVMRRGTGGVIALASASAADALHAVAAGRVPPALRLAAIGPITARRARALGYRVSVVARVFTALGLAQALARWWARRAPGAAAARSREE